MHAPSLALLIALVGAPLLALGCSDGGKGSAGGAGDVAEGKKLYGQMCASCHGRMGEGAIGPALNPWTGSEAALVAGIAGRMPKNDPSSCDAACAADVAAYIVGWPRDCAGEYAPPRLRLLNRREYDNTVRDLLFPSSSPGAGACQSDPDCDIAHASCVGGACVADPCNLHTFVLPAGGQHHASVAVAGSFNGWSPSAGAEWQMTYVASQDLWVLKHTIPDGSSTYKLVIDGSTWITDPGNPDTQDDGFGGKNSLLLPSCAAGGKAAPDGFHPSKDFPVETRPPGYAFDKSADAGLVTSVHVDQYLRAAKALAKQALESPGNLVPCDSSGDKAAACAAELARSFGERAFRRPLTGDEVAKYAGLVTAQPDFLAGASVLVQVMLSSPYFLYRSEIGVRRADGTSKLTPHETATALSYLFWASMPDQPLFEAAAGGELGSASGIEEQARRLLADPRSRPVVEAFSLQWLGVESILVAEKSEGLYPGFDDGTRQALADETRTFVSHVVFDGSRRYDELLTADYTFANGASAGLYGISGVSGAAMQKVASPAERRSGLLGHGSVLGAYAYADQSSPVRRGLFVRRNLLCQDFPKPPPNGGKVPAVDPEVSTRERFSQHSQDPACHACHQYIDGVGFGFERFDAIGRYRETENGKPIDASGDMNDVDHLGSGADAPYTSLGELGGILAGSESPKACFARQIFRFTRGALEAPEDRCALDGIVSRFAAGGYDIQELMIAVATAPSFTLRK